MLQIKSALISVFDKNGLEPIVKKLDSLGVIIYSTGGTESFLKKLNIPVIKVENITSYPSILGGRVKTLHPKVFGGILNRSENKNDLADITKYDIPNIDLVIVDLYPFEKTVTFGESEEGSDFEGSDEQQFDRMFNEIIADAIAKSNPVALKFLTLP